MRASAVLGSWQLDIGSPCDPDWYIRIQNARSIRHTDDDDEWRAEVQEKENDWRKKENDSKLFLFSYMMSFATSSLVDMVRNFDCLIELLSHDDI